MDNNETEQVIPVTQLPAHPNANPMGLLAERYRAMLIERGIDPDTGEDVRTPGEIAAAMQPSDAQPSDVASVDEFTEVMDDLSESELEYISDRMKELPVIASLLDRVGALERKAQGV